MNQPAPVSDVALANAYHLLAETRAETLWLANFISPNTKATYRRAVADFIVDMGLSSPAELYGAGQAHVLAWRDQLRARGLSNAAVKTKLAALSSLYKFLADKQLSPGNPVAGVRRPIAGSAGIGAGTTPALTRRQARLLMDAPMTHQGQRKTPRLQQLRDRALLYTFFYTGCRCMEPGTLTVGDFGIDRGYWVLTFTVKGEKKNKVALAEFDAQEAECVQAILDYLDASGHRHDQDAPLFLAARPGKNTGQALGRSTFYDVFKKYVRLVGLPDTITPHSARSTFITQAYENGVQGEAIQRTVGHASITTTEGYNQSAKKLRKSASLGVRY